jgi:hypothetical protein
LGVNKKIFIKTILEEHDIDTLLKSQLQIPPFRLGIEGAAGTMLIPTVSSNSVGEVITVKFNVQNVLGKTIFV